MTTICNNCRSTLEADVTFCPKCGTPAPAYYSHSGSSQIDPTVVPGSADTIYQKTSTDYGSPPYGMPDKNPYDPSNPYGTKPPPPPPRIRSSLIVGIISGTVVSILILGVVGTFVFLTARGERSSVSPISSSPVPTTPATPSQVPLLGAIKTSSGNYLTAVNNGGLGGPNSGPGSVPIHTDATQVGPWEKFTIVEQPGGTFAFRTVNGNYVTAVNGGGIGGPNNNQYPIHTDATQVGPWEKFTFLKQPDGTFAIRTDGGFYLTAVNGGGWGEAANQYPIHTDGTQVGPWEMFTLVPIG